MKTVIISLINKLGMGKCSYIGSHNTIIDNLVEYFGKDVVIDEIDSSNPNEKVFIVAPAYETDDKPFYLIYHIDNEKKMVTDVEIKEEL